MTTSFRKPKGTYNRPGLDWYYKDAGSVGGEQHGPFTFPPYKYFVWSLFNNDSLSRSLHVHGFAFSNDGLGLTVWGTGGQPAGSLVRAATPVWFSQPSPPGQLWLNTVSVATEFSDTVITVAGTVPSYFGTGPYFPGGAMWVIPAQQSLVVTTVEGNLDVAVNFWFVPLAD